MAGILQSLRRSWSVTVTTRVIVVSLRIVVRTERKEDLIRAMRSMLGPTSVASGCESCRLYQDLANDNAVFWVEEWTDRVDLDRHLRSAGYRTILEALELAEERPEVHFNTIQQSAGIELIAEARLGLGTTH